MSTKQMNRTRDEHSGAMGSIMTSMPVDRPNTETVKVRQGTGPRATVAVLFVSLLAAAVAGFAIVGYFVWHGHAPEKPNIAVTMPPAK